MIQLHRPIFILVGAEGSHIPIILEPGDRVAINRSNGTTRLYRGDQDILFKIARPDTDQPYAPSPLRVSGMEDNVAAVDCYVVAALIAASSALNFTPLDSKGGIEIYELVSNAA